MIDKPPAERGASSLYGEQLMAALEDEAGGLSMRTLVTLVVGGLRVRLMRSVVTMISVILAIAFLTYMGLFNFVQYNLARSIEELEAIVPLPPAEVAEVAAAMESLDLFGAMPIDRKRAVALALDMDDVKKLAHEQTELGGELTQAEGVHLKAVEELQKRESEKATAAELEGARAHVDTTQEKVEKLKGRESVLLGRIALGRWIKGGSASDEEMAAYMTRELQTLQKKLLKVARTPSRFSEQQMTHMTELLPLAEVHEGGTEPAATMRTALDQERDKRDAAKMRLMLRRAGVSVESTLAGNPMDTWLIIMALLTCTVGIANAMLMSVTERFREIGTMKCLGAQDALVVKLFLMESAFQGIVGAVLGIGVGLVVALASSALQFYGYGLVNFPVIEMWQVCGWSMLSGMLLAVLGAVPSALMAARMNPVDALRVEE